jgi:hypothetical protein
MRGPINLFYWTGFFLVIEPSIFELENILQNHRMLNSEIEYIQSRSQIVGFEMDIRSALLAAPELFTIVSDPHRNQTHRASGYGSISECAGSDKGRPVWPRRKKLYVLKSWMFSRDD